MTIRPCMFLLMFVLALTVSAGAGTKPPMPPDNPPPVVPEAKTARVVKEFPSYQKAGRRWRNVVVSSDNSIEALTALAKRLHAEDPTSAFWIYTDGNEQQFRRLMLWDQHYAQADSARYPSLVHGPIVTVSPSSTNFGIAAGAGNYRYSTATGSSLLCNWGIPLIWTEAQNGLIEGELVSEAFDEDEEGCT